MAKDNRKNCITHLGKTRIACLLHLESKYIRYQALPFNSKNMMCITSHL